MGLRGCQRLKGSGSRVEGLPGAWSVGGGETPESHQGVPGTALLGGESMDCKGLLGLSCGRFCAGVGLLYWSGGERAGINNLRCDAGQRVERS